MILNLYIFNLEHVLLNGYVENSSVTPGGYGVVLTTKDNLWQLCKTMLLLLSKDLGRTSNPQEDYLGLMELQNPKFPSTVGIWKHYAGTSTTDVTII